MFLKKIINSNLQNIKVFLRICTIYWTGNFCLKHQTTKFEWIWNTKTNYFVKYSFKYYEYFVRIIMKDNFFVDMAKYEWKKIVKIIIL